MVKSSKNIILTGFMGSGKSEVGRLLAERMKLNFYDMDDIIAEAEGTSVSDIFAKKGETYFRNLETSFLKGMSMNYPFVLSTGGGVVIRKENRESLNTLGIVIYLETSAETVFERLAEDESRPLLQVPNALEKIKVMIQERAAAYSDCDITQKTDGLSVEDVVKGIFTMVSSRENAN